MSTHTTTDRRRANPVIAFAGLLFVFAAAVVAISAFVTGATGIDALASGLLSIVVACVGWVLQRMYGRTI